MKPTISFSLSLAQPNSHLFQIKLKLCGFENTNVRLALPVWTPGSYLVREFSQHISDIQAHASTGTPINITQHNKCTWQLQSSAASMTITYAVYAHTLGVRSNHFDAQHAFVLGAATFFAVQGYTDIPITLSIVPPPGWLVETPLRRLPQQPHTVIADNFDHLLDCPIDVAPAYTTANFEVLGKKHRFAIWGRGNYNLDNIIRDTSAIIQTSAAMFGNTLPYDDYLFILHSAIGARGGLEHANSCTLGWDALAFAEPKKYTAFLRLVAHEHFHAWNIKRLRPAQLGPFDYYNEVHSRTLWLHEGGTVYYDGLVPVRAGVISPHQWLDDIAESISKLLKTPGQQRMSVADASFNAWTHLYRPQENSPNQTISYYLKGELVCLCLDQWLRAHSSNEQGLDDVMQYIFNQCSPPSPGYDEQQLPALIHQATQVDISDFFARYIDGTEPLPLAKALAWYGLGLELHGATPDQDAATSVAPPSPQSYLGIQTIDGDAGALVKHVYDNSPAAFDGIYPGDEIIAINQFRVTSNSLNTHLNHYAPGECIDVALFRRQELQHCTIKLASLPKHNASLKPSATASEAQKSRLEHLLRQPFSSLIAPPT